MSRMSTQLPLFRHYEVPLNPQREAYQLLRVTDPDTSYEAAEAIVPELRELQVRVLALFEAYGPMTHHTLIRLYREQYGPTAESTIRTRCAELVSYGLLVDTGRRDVLLSGRRAAVWARADDTH